MQTTSSSKLPTHQILQYRTPKSRSYSLPSIPEQEDDLGIKSLDSSLPRIHKKSYQINKGIFQRAKEMGGELDNAQTSSSQFQIFSDGNGVKKSTGVLGFLGIKSSPSSQEPSAEIKPSPTSSPTSSASSDSPCSNDEFFQYSNSSNINVVTPLLVPQPVTRKCQSDDSQRDHLGSLAETIIGVDGINTTNPTGNVYNNTSGSCSDDEDDNENLNDLKPPDPFYPPEDPPVQPPKGPQPHPDPNPPTLPPEKIPKKGKNIILCFDGTSETFGANPHTNVLKFFKLLDRSDKTVQVSYYQRKYFKTCCCCC